MSTFIVWIFYFMLFWEFGIQTSLVAVLLYFGVLHFLVQYYFAKYILLYETKDEKKIKYYFFPIIAISIPAFLTAALYDITYEMLSYYSLTMLLVSYVYLFLSENNIFSYFSSLGDDEKWGSNTIKNVYFSKYPPREKSDSRGMDALMIFVVVLTFVSFVV